MWGRAGRQLCSQRNSPGPRHTWAIRRQLTLACSDDAHACDLPDHGCQCLSVISCSRISQERQNFSLGTHRPMHSFKLHLSPVRDRVAIDGTTAMPEGLGDTWHVPQAVSCSGKHQPQR